MAGYESDAAETKPADSPFTRSAVRDDGGCEEQEAETTAKTNDGMTCTSLNASCEVLAKIWYIYSKWSVLVPVGYMAVKTARIDDEGTKEIKGRS